MLPQHVSEDWIGTAKLREQITAPWLPPSEVQPRSSYRPRRLAYILNHILKLVSKKPKKATVPVLGILSFQRRHLVSNATHGLDRCTEEETKPNGVEAHHDPGHLSSWRHTPIYAEKNFSDLDQVGSAKMTSS